MSWRDALGRVDHQRVRARVGPDRYWPVVRAPPRAFAARSRGRHASAAAAGSAELRLELGGQVLGVGIVQVHDERVAALRRRRIEVRDHRAVLSRVGPSPANRTLLVRLSAMA